MRRWTLIAVMSSIASLSAQQGGSNARVDVISIKVAKGPDDIRRLPCGLPSVERTGGRIYIPFSQLCGLVLVAYNVAEYQVAGIPEDRGVGPTNFFEIAVRLDGGVVPTMDDTRLIIRNLLAERFKLRVRREPQERPIYALMVAKDGPKAMVCADPKAVSGYTRGLMRSCNPPIPMPRLLQFLSNEAGRPVFDKTGLPSLTFELRWLPSLAEPEPGSPPGLFTAIQEQLGLKLEPQRGPIDIVVVDSVEPPTPN